MFIDASASFSASAFALLTRGIVARRAERALRELPEYLLRDLGLDRGEIASVVRGGRSR